MKKIFASSILLSALSATATAQSITGTVLNADSVAMPFTTIFIDSLNIGTTTDSNGRYEITGVKEGVHRVRVSYIGYKTQVTDIAFRRKTVARKDFRMEDENITLDELVVLPDGTDFGHYVMSKLEANIKPLKQRIESYECHTTGVMEKHIDLTTLKHRRTIRFALSLAGYGKVFDIMTKYKDLMIKISEDVTFNKGKIRNTDPVIHETDPEMTEREAKSIIRKDWMLNDNSYDRFYDQVKSKIKGLKKKNSKYDVKYCGSYTEDGHQIHIIRYGKTQVDVVDGCWQIRRMTYKSGTRKMYFEFHELAKDVFMPVSGYANFNLDYEGYPHGTVSMSLAYSYRNIKARL